MRAQRDKRARPALAHAQRVSSRAMGLVSTRSRTIRIVEVAAIDVALAPAVKRVAVIASTMARAATEPAHLPKAIRTIAVVAALPARPTRCAPLEPAQRHVPQR